MQYLKRLGRTIAIVAGFMGAMLAATVAFAEGTDSNVTVTNNVSLAFTVNAIPQTANASTDFLVDRKLIVDVTTVDTNWVTVVPGQSTAAPGVPAMNFTVTNRSNGAENVLVGLLDQDGTAITLFSSVGATVFNETAIVVARDTNGNQAYDDTIDAVIAPTTPLGSIYDLGILAEDEIVNLVVAVDVPAVGNDEYAAYTLVGAVANGGVAIDSDDSGNVAPNSPTGPAPVPNGINTLQFVFAEDDGVAANSEDEQFDFFVVGGAPLVGSPVDVSFNGQNADSSGLVTGSTLSLAKFVEVIYDPVIGNRYDNTGAQIAEPKSIPGAVLMYVIGLANESVALDAAAVTIADDIPDGTPEVVDEGDQSGFAGPIDLPLSVTFNVGTGPQSFNVGNATNLDEVYSEGCTDPGTTAAYNGAGVVLGGDDTANPEFSVSVGTCAATDTAFVVYFVTINQ
jgi:hypothetical protein